MEAAVRALFKFFVIAGVVLGVAAILGLFVMSSLARIDGVKEVPIPTESYISGHARNADYADSYRIEMKYNPFRHIHDVMEHAFEKGSGAIYSTDKEVCYEGVAPGLTYRISYILEKDADPPSLTVSTTVHYVAAKGEWYFTAVNPLHKMLTPYMVDRMSKVTIN
jgi:hypothetical protein